MSRISRNVSRALALLLMMICAGCVSSRQAVLQRELPPAADSLMRPVELPRVARGDDPKARLAQSLDTLKEANKRIENGRAWYEGVRRSYSAGEVTP